MKGGSWVGGQACCWIAPEPILTRGSQRILGFPEMPGPNHGLRWLSGSAPFRSGCAHDPGSAARLGASIMEGSLQRREKAPQPSSNKEVPVWGPARPARTPDWQYFRERRL